MEEPLAGIRKGRSRASSASALAIHSLLLVEDDPEDAGRIRRAFRAAAPGLFRIHHESRLGDALAILARRTFDAVLLDLGLPDSSGAEGVQRINAACPDLPVLVLTSFDDTQVGRHLILEGAQDYLVKGEFSGRAMVRSVEHAIERHKLRRELRMAREAALQGSAAKSAFLAAVSHDIRTPLGSILGMADLLLASPLNSDQTGYARVVQRSGNALLSLLNNVLELSSIEGGHFRLHAEPFHLEDLVAETLELFAFTVHKKRIGLALEIDPRLPERVVGDAARIRQVLVNLVANAVKFTDRGGVSVLVVQDGPLPGTSIRFEVRDTGPGIPRERSAAIFERFVQGSAAAGGGHGGVGLGLAICRELVTRMEGDLAISPAAGPGATLLFRLPLPAAPDARVREACPLRGTRALVAMRDGAERRAVIRTLGDAGARVHASGDASDALAAFQGALAAEDPFEAVLSDCRLAGGGGLRLLCDMDRPDPPPRRVAFLTIDHRAGDVSECREQGITALLKPLRPQLLVDAVLGREVAPLQDDSGALPDLHASRLLLVEDSPDNRALLLAWLRNAGCEVTALEDGEAALERLARERFDLVLMDVDMPKLSGLEATERFRRLEELAHGPRTPVIALTAHAFREDAERCIRAGCDAHVTKPIDRAALLRLVAKHVAVPVQDVPPDVADLVPGYLQNRRRDVRELREALLGGDLRRARRLGHRMRGSGGGYGFPEISRLGACIEEAAARLDAGALGRAVDALAVLVARLERSFPPEAGFTGASAGTPGNAAG